MPPKEIPTLSLAPGGPPFKIEATSYGTVAPSGLGEFDTEAEAVTAMNALAVRLDAQRGAKPQSKQAMRKKVEGRA